MGTHIHDRSQVNKEKNDDDESKWQYPPLYHTRYGQVVFEVGDYAVPEGARRGLPQLELWGVPVPISSLDGHRG